MKSRLTSDFAERPSRPLRGILGKHLFLVQPSLSLGLAVLLLRLRRETFRGICTHWGVSGCSRCLLSVIGLLCFTQVYTETSSIVDLEPSRVASSHMGSGHSTAQWQGPLCVCSKLGMLRVDATGHGRCWPAGLQKPQHGIPQMSQSLRSQQTISQQLS